MIGAARRVGLALLCAAILSPAAAAERRSGAANPFQPRLLERLGCGRDAAPRAPPVTTGFGETLEILVIGSSSTAGVGAGGRARGYPALAKSALALRLRARGRAPRLRIIARGVSGEDAAGALRRLEAALARAAPDLVIWQVGTNDALRGVAPAALQRTIRGGIAASRRRGVPIMLIDPQYFPRIEGRAAYAAIVSAIAETAAETRAPLIKRYARMRRARRFGPDATAALLAADRFHMSRLGHACLALDLAAAIAP